MGKGMVNIHNKQGHKIHVPDVYYTPGLKDNLISVGQLTENGYDVIFKGNDSFIYDKPPSDMLISRVKMIKNRMYTLSMKYDRQDVYLV
jgi:hypothetical protein